MTIQVAVAVLAFFVIATAVAHAGPDEVSGVLIPSPVGEWSCVAVEFDLDAAGDLSGIEWYNNDALASFAEVIVLEASDGPPDLTGPGISIANVSGDSSAWSTLSFGAPLSSATGKAFVVFRYPSGAALTGRGQGTGPGVGFSDEGQGQAVYVTHDGVSWVQLATEFSLAVRAQGASLGRTISTPLASLERDADLTVIPDMEGDSESQTVVSSSVSMAQPTPNPFNPRTEVSFSVPHQARVDLQVYDVRGRRVRTLVSGVLGAGAHRVVWDGTDDVHQAVASGVYFMKLMTNTKTLTRRMTLIR